MVTSGIARSAVGAFLAVALSSLVAPGTASSAGEDGVALVPGNCNGDGRWDLSDPIFLVDFLFRGGGQPRCASLCDFNQDARLDVSDIVNLLQYSLMGIGQPAALPEAACAGAFDLDLAWEPVITDVLGEPETVMAYRIYVWTEISRGIYSPITLLKETSPECACTVLEGAEIRALIQGSHHFIYVTAVDAAGNESTPSNPVEFIW